MTQAPARAPDVAGAVCAYATRSREVLLPEGFEVQSYAGLWLLLATLGPVTTGHEREELEAALGVPVEEAATLAAQLLAERRDDLGARSPAGFVPVPPSSRPCRSAWRRCRTRTGSTPGRGHRRGAGSRRSR